MSTNLSQKTRVEIAQQVIDALEHRVYRKVLAVEEIHSSSVILYMDDEEEVPVSGFVAEKILNGISSQSLMEKQVEVAQSWLDIISNANPKYKGRKVIDVESTKHTFEVIVRLDDRSKVTVTGLDAKHILAGKLPNTGESNGRLGS